MFSCILGLLEVNMLHTERSKDKKKRNDGYLKMIKHSICHPPDCLFFIITGFVDSPRSHAQFTDESNFCVAAVKSCIFKKARIIHNKMIDFPTNPLSLETTFSLQTLNQFSVYCETHLRLLLFVMFSLINCNPSSAES